MDVLIVGGGPAGLAAALALGRVRRETLLVDSGEPRNAPSPEMHNFLSRDDGIAPGELRRIGREQLSGYASVRIADAAMQGVSRRDDGRFAVSLGTGEEAVARRLLLATGVMDELPEVEGLRELWGKSALHCPYCHGYEFRDLPLAVLGGAPDRVRLALHLTRLSPDVALCTHGAPPLDPELRGKLESQGVVVHEQPVARFEGEGGRLDRIVFEDGSALVRRAVFVQSRLRQRSTLAVELGCSVFEDGIVEVDDFGRTTVPGVYAAGDMARRASMPMPASTVIAAAASGTTAAARLDQDLVAADFGLPLPF